VNNCGAVIPVSAVEFDAEVEASVLAVLRSGNLAQGPVVERLEHDFAEMIGVEHVIAVNNGTTALTAALEVLDLQTGDEVITSPFSFIATLNSILHVGATVRFADISASDFNIDPNAIEPLLGPRTKVLLPVHLFGQAANMEAISAMAESRELHIVEDAAQAHGATFAGRSVGTWGTGCFSLYATKNLTSGEGGLISTNDPDVADRLRLLRNQGMRERYVYESTGYNYRLTDLQAAVCVPQLASYPESVAARRANAAVLTAGLEDLPWITTPSSTTGCGHVWHQYTILVDDDAPVTREALGDHLARKGVGSGVYYPRTLGDHHFARSHPRVVHDDVPVARDTARRCLSLPVHPHLTPASLETIIDAMHSVGR
jgi:perosamine synthetase